MNCSPSDVVGVDFTIPMFPPPPGVGVLRGYDGISGIDGVYASGIGIRGLWVSGWRSILETDENREAGTGGFGYYVAG